MSVEPKITSSASPSQSMGDDTVLGPSRRTVLASERTWLAWFRTGAGVAAVAVAVGAVIPRLVEGARWPFIALGVGYGLVSIAVFAIGYSRYHEIDGAIKAGEDISSAATVLLWLTASGMLLALLTMLAMVFLA